MTLICSFFLKRLWHRCFPVNFAKFVGTRFLQSTSEWLLLSSANSAKTGLLNTSDTFPVVTWKATSSFKFFLFLAYGNQRLRLEGRTICGWCDFTSILFIRIVFRSTCNRVFQPNQINMYLIFLNNKIMHW